MTELIDSKDGRGGLWARGPIRKWILRHVFNYCLLCNSPDHQAQDCWIPQHRYYSGLVYGRIYADPPVYRAWLDAIPFGEVEPEWARERVTEVRTWAADQAFKSRKPKEIA